MLLNLTWLMKCLSIHPGLKKHEQQFKSQKRATTYLWEYSSKTFFLKSIKSPR